jgi:hypothetical protein
MNSLSRIAEAAIPASNLLLKAGTAATQANLCGAADVPIGVSANNCAIGERVQILALTDDIFALTASGAIAFGAAVEPAAGGKVATYATGEKIGRAMEAAAGDGSLLLVAVNTSGVVDMSRESATVITYAASVAVNCAGSSFAAITLAGNVAFTTSNRGNGRYVSVIIASDGSERTLSFESGWRWLGTKPTTIAASKIGMLSLCCTGTFTGDVVAAYAVEA